MSRCTAMPGNCANPCKSSKVSVNPLKPPAVRKARSPTSIRAASRTEARMAPPLRNLGATL